MRCGFRVCRKPAGLLLGILVLSTASQRTAYGEALPDSVTEITYGRNGGFGSEHFPANVLGPPHGTLNAGVPNDSPNHLLSLGTGGSITYEFSTNRIIDEPGPDFTVFENPVQPDGHPEQTFADTAVVEVSSDGIAWFTFPFDMKSSATAQVKLKENYIGFAGIQPSYSSPDNGISPFDPAVSGGDKFDLQTVGLTSARFIRITDSGETTFEPSYDIHNDIVYDFGDLVDPDPTQEGLGISAGFDIDAVVAVHSEPYVPSAITDWQFYE